MNTELNERIALEVMGYVRERGYIKRPEDSEYTHVRFIPNYSGDIAAAWLVVEELEKHGIYLTLEIEHNRAMATFTKPLVARYFIASPTAPLAIAWAATGIAAKVRDICEKLKVRVT